MLKILYIINLIFCIPIIFVFIMKDCRKDFFIGVNSLPEKFMTYILLILTGVLGLIIGCIPVLSTIACIAYLLKLYEEYSFHKKSKNIRKKEKKSRKKQSIEDLYKEIRDADVFDSYYNYNDRYKYDNFLSLIKQIYKQYEDISKTDFSSELVENRFENILNILKHSMDNNLFNENKNNKDFLKEIEEMLKSANTFFDEILSEIKENEDKVAKEMQDYIKDKVKEFIDTTKSMEQDFKDINKKNN